LLGFFLQEVQSPRYWKYGATSKGKFQLGTELKLHDRIKSLFQSLLALVVGEYYIINIKLATVLRTFDRQRKAFPPL